MRSWVRPLSAATICLLMHGCAKRQPSSEAPQSQEGLPDDIAALEQQLDDHELELQTLGVGLPLGELVPEADEAPATADGAAASRAEESAAPAPTAAPEDEPEPSKRRQEKDRCDRICSLAEATCTLADHICDLAARHPDAMRYQDACHRAEDQCRQAGTACEVCS